MIAALVLAAGLSRRMGTNKLLLPFGDRPILAHIVDVLRECLLGEILVVTGHEREKVKEMLARYVSSGPRRLPLRFIHNPHYAAGEMLSSIQAGLAAMPPDAHAALIVLGDQPQIEARVVEQVIAAHTPGRVIVPSYRRRGGHPILIDRACWEAVLAAPAESNLGQVIRAHPAWTRYLDVDAESVLRDIDTPEDYSRIK